MAHKQTHEEGLNWTAHCVAFGLERSGIQSIPGRWNRVAVEKQNEDLGRSRNDGQIACRY